MSMQKNAYGIDFGTTNSIVAVYESLNDKILSMTNDEGFPHRSFIWYNGDEIKVGNEAIQNFNKFSHQAGHAFVSSIKSKLGRGEQLSILGEMRPAFEVASDIFSYLKEHAEQKLNKIGSSSDIYEVDEVVITVPVKFDGRQRSDIRKAAQMAGIHVKTFVHEPFAGIIGYLFANGSHLLEQLEGKYFLVFDWGGGTLDTTVVKYEKGRLFELGTGGIPNRAGDYFDQLIEERVIAKFIEQKGLNPLAVQIQPQVKDRLKHQSEQNKIKLSVEDVVTFRWISLFEFGGERFTVEEVLSRNEFQALIHETVVQALREIDSTLKQASIDHQQVYMTLLIGGTSKIPYVVQEIEKLFGSRTYEAPNSDTVIAEGAAIIAKNNWRPFLVNPICLQLSDQSYYTVFDEGTILIPNVTKKEVTLFVTDNRDGEGRLIITEKRNGNQQIVKDLINIPISKSLTKNNVERVSVKFWIDEDLVLNVQAYGQIQNRVVKSVIHDICYGLQIEGGD